MEGYVYIDGEIVPAEAARVSALDRGLLYGDGLFETMRVEGGRVHLLERHLARLGGSAAMLEIAAPATTELRDALQRTIEANDCRQGIVRLTLTRGIARGGPASQTDAATLLVTQRPLLQPQNQPTPIRLVTLEQQHQPPETPTRIKSLSYLGYVLAAREAARRHAAEGVMLTASGFVAEGSISNIFIVSQGRVRTAPVSLGVLPGIARGRVLELAERSGIAASEEPFGRDELYRADEIFFTNAARGVVVAGAIDGRDLSSHAPVASLLREAYLAEMPDEAL